MAGLVVETGVVAGIAGLVVKIADHLVVKTVDHLVVKTVGHLVVKTVGHLVVGMADPAVEIVEGVVVDLFVAE